MIVFVYKEKRGNNGKENKREETIILVSFIALGCSIIVEIVALVAEEIVSGSLRLALSIDDEALLESGLDLVPRHGEQEALGRREAIPGSARAEVRG